MHRNLRSREEIKETNGREDSKDDVSHHVVPAEDLQDVVEQFQAVPPLVVRPVGHGGQRPAQLPQHHGQQHITALCEQTTTDDDAGGRKLFHQ